MVPGILDSIAKRLPMSLLNSVDFPVFGRPTIATTGSIKLGCCDTDRFYTTIRASVRQVLNYCHPEPRGFRGAKDLGLKNTCFVWQSRSFGRFAPSG